MDTFGQIGPEKGDYEDDCRKVVTMLDMGHPVHVKHVAHLTKYEITLAEKDMVSFIGGYAAGIGTEYDDAYTLVVIDSHGGYWFARGSYHDPEYVASKLGLGTWPDAIAVAGFLNRVEQARGAEFPFDLYKQEAEEYEKVGRKAPAREV